MEQPAKPNLDDLLRQLVDRAIPPLERRVVDHDINGTPIYADEVKENGRG
jgi:hypothetical protein